MSLYDDIQAAQLLVSQDKSKLAADQAYLDSLLAQQVKDGPDISQYQGTVDWAKVAANASFTFLRTSDGDIRDTSYNGTTVAAIRQAGIPFGPYHFGRVASDGNDQRNGRVEAGMAVYFARAAGWGKSGDIPLAYDFETLNGQTEAKAAKHLLQFIKTYQFIMQHSPIIYSNPSTLTSVIPQIALQPDDLATLKACPLWIANWGVTSPTVPAPWTAWTFWQYTNSGSIPGVTGSVDLSHFSGSVTDLGALRIP